MTDISKINLEKISFGKMKKHKKDGYYIPLQNIKSVKLPPLRVFSNGIYNDDNIDLVLGKSNQTIFQFFLDLDDLIINYITDNCESLFKSKIPDNVLEEFYLSLISNKQNYPVLTFTVPKKLLKFNFKRKQTVQLNLSIDFVRILERNFYLETTIEDVVEVISNDVESIFSKQSFRSQKVKDTQSVRSQKVKDTQSVRSQKVKDIQSVRSQKAGTTKVKKNIKLEKKSIQPSKITNLSQIKKTDIDKIENDFNNYLNQNEQIEDSNNDKKLQKQIKLVKEIIEDAKKQNELAYQRRIEAYKALKNLRKLEMEFLEKNCKSIQNN